MMNEGVKCPECNKELKEGYIFSPRRINWSESPDPVYFALEGEVLVKDAYVKIRKIPALRCEDCKIVLFKYNLMDEIKKI